MAAICFRTHEFATDPEGDLVYCNGVPGSQVAGWIRDALLKQGCACRGLIQEDYGWGFWVDAAECSIWVAVSYAAPSDPEPTGVPEWQVAVEHDFPPWALRQWLRVRRGREVAFHIFSLVEHLIASHPGVVAQTR
jgi:hypothetical protein